MRRGRYLVLGALLTITALAGAQSAPLSRQPTGNDPVAATNNQLLRIVSPVASQQLSNNAITARFELINPAAYTKTPNFLVQLDGTEPVRTGANQQSFTGLAAGAHSITVTLVDSSSSPVPGGRVSVPFTIASLGEQPATSTENPDKRNLNLGEYKFQKPDPSQNSADADLPKASSPLPLISVIGFGILVGGIVSAMKTRS